VRVRVRIRIRVRVGVRVRVRVRDRVRVRVRASGSYEGLLVESIRHKYVSLDRLGREGRRERCALGLG
jgi:hypothetical protein